MKLQVQAELNGISEFFPLDTPESPFEYVFKIQCTSCREIHEKEVSINTIEKHEISGSRGEASFVFKCKICKRESSTTIQRTKNNLTSEDESKFVDILDIDSRGLQLVEFIPVGEFVGLGESGTKFSVELEDGEWYDYDDNAGTEVSVTNVTWNLV
ncbi:hypothetical protein PP7435_CHR1-1159 [Komagataella phaffii CBS 7435]|uniref:DUF866-domain-containing protein n=2 Tax=Komagataella phaffii TaxID=460519 RepID=C4QY94_KOMPG|nr:uncharacterized protein PAS_chr1-4_0372 [Komagataella phaffii GS115]AOA61828.1 GQ67_01795T0 [Komagataella phaffii]KAI0464418.1 hypothetical protein LJB42_002033 [Komagataella kurtzmanii]CAH2447039.1 hypothetical protein BQ9382_C1-6110 [Komagataella phaffii CBS 7435]AOA66895.1 GQ68_01810T0 [Komagataella phaffii GS115]CAY68217.1 hypothetical protein PAS_chr1-4_0372 [Komagataella phaffii GS115]